jgi:hypothetical protein
MDLSRYDGKTFVTLTTSDGLASNHVYALARNSAGLVGVSRFDGTTITSFTPMQGLCINGVLCILPDRSGRIWFGAGDRGVCRYDASYVKSVASPRGG